MKKDECIKILKEAYGSYKYIDIDAVVDLLKNNGGIQEIKDEVEKYDPPKSECFKSEIFTKSEISKGFYLIHSLWSDKFNIHWGFKNPFGRTRAYNLSEDQYKHMLKITNKCIELAHQEIKEILEAIQNGSQKYKLKKSNIELYINYVNDEIQISSEKELNLEQLYPTLILWNYSKDYKWGYSLLSANKAVSKWINMHLH